MPSTPRPFAALTRAPLSRGEFCGFFVFSSSRKSTPKSLADLDIFFTTSGLPNSPLERGGPGTKSINGNGLQQHQIRKRPRWWRDGVWKCCCKPQNPDNGYGFSISVLFGFGNFGGGIKMPEWLSRMGRAQGIDLRGSAWKFGRLTRMGRAQGVAPTRRGGGDLSRRARGAPGGRVGDAIPGWLTHVGRAQGVAPTVRGALVIRGAREARRGA
ncbi:hypothetical protein CYPRO_1116 [Cyclonatronum proteinivorum]|uniref:Uncharacterized protein n=1 Tax=Cyclonatronum proteinivorum TaxID=1457365 RepID=A0A345UIS9_9BACT|nr:hypothetical protein CYPRO_1116 [Cyclonatronum proteinivorum]